MAQYAPPPMGPRRAASIADLILHRGDIAAQNSARSGAIWGSTINQLGQIAAGAYQQHSENKQAEQQQAIEAQRGEAIANLASSELWETDPKAAFGESIRILGPEKGATFVKARMAAGEAQKAQDPEEKRKLVLGNLGVIASGFKAAGPTGRRLMYPLVQEMLTGAGVEGLPPEWDESNPENMAAVEQIIQGFTPQETAPAVGSDAWMLSATPEEKAAVLANKTAVAEASQLPDDVIESQAAARARGTAKGSPPKPPSGSGKASYVLDRDAEPGTDPHVLKTPEEVAAEPGRYGRPLFAGPTDELRRIETNLFAFRDINAALEPVLDKVGPVEYTLRELQQKAPFLESDPAFRAFQQMVNALTNEEIRRITGAQMSAAEATRLKKGMADGSLRLPELREALYIWQRGMERSRAGLMGNLKRWEESNPYTPTYFHGEKGLPKETQSALNELFPPEDQ